MIPRTARQAREAGFTLIELLVALTLLAVLMAALFGALRLGTRVWETGEARLDASTRVQVVQDFLRQQLSQTVPMTEITNNPRISGAMLFTGARREVRFVSLLPGHLGAGVSLMELAARPRPRGGRSADLVIRIRPLDLTDDAGTQSETEERVLVEGIESIELAYFGAEHAGTEPVWWQEWQDQRALPTLIRLRVGFAKDDHRRWPELLVSPMVDLPPPFQL